MAWKVTKAGGNNCIHGVLIDHNGFLYYKYAHSFLRGISVSSPAPGQPLDKAMQPPSKQPTLPDQVDTVPCDIMEVEVPDDRPPIPSPPTTAEERRDAYQTRHPGAPRQEPTVLFPPPDPPADVSTSGEGTHTKHKEVKEAEDFTPSDDAKAPVFYMRVCAVMFCAFIYV